MCIFRNKKEKNNESHCEIETDVLIEDIVKNDIEIQERKTMLNDIVVENKLKNIIIELIKYEKDNNISNNDVIIGSYFNIYHSNKEVTIYINYTANNNFDKEFLLTFNKKIDFPIKDIINKINNIYWDEYVKSIDNISKLKKIKKISLL